MKKPKGNKKNKIKKQWSKQCGHFTFKKIRFGTNNNIKIGAFYKGEEFGYLSVLVNKKNDYSCEIYDFTGHIFLGLAHCSGALHQLPKKIEYVALNGDSPSDILCPERKTLTEKHISKNTMAPKITRRSYITIQH